MRAVLTVSLLALVVASPAVMAVGLNQTTVRIDLDTNAPGTQTTNAASPWAVGQSYLTHLVLEPTNPGPGVIIEDLTGISADVEFDPNILELVDIYELKGDVNFDGFQDVTDMVTIFQSAAFDTSREDEGYIGYYDIDRDDFVDVTDMVRIFQSEQFDTAGGEYWTNNEGEFVRESVEIFDDPRLSNTGGAHPGFIDDVVAVLLLRPDANNDGFADDGSGFNTNAWSGERAVIATMQFRVKAAPAGGTTQIAVVNDSNSGTRNPPVAIGKTTPVEQPFNPGAGVSTVSIGS